MTLMGAIQWGWEYILYLILFKYQERYKWLQV